MATPILNTVPSYDVNNGVTLTFNSNYGTNLIRGSKVTIRDQNQNVLATHIYIPSTLNEASAQHIIPSKQALINESIQPEEYSGSTTYQVDAIVTYGGATYRNIQTSSGVPPTNAEYWTKLTNNEAILSTIASNFDTAYVNEVQLQFLISVFVDYTVSDYEVTLIGESANSNARGAWILPNPTIVFDTISETISTTSYTIGLTYNTNQITSIGQVYNPPQSMDFTLYKNIDGEWESVQNSGNVYNSGNALSDSSYYANYPFSLLNNGATYKVGVSITSLLGMESVAETTPFTVNATTYQISAFSVNNDSCNGKIDIVSNIIDVAGTSSTEPVDGEIDLTNNGAYCTWNQGLGFTNNWTTRLWGYDFNVADAIEEEKAVVHLQSSVTEGIINGYMVELEDGYRFDLYVYPTGYDGVASYFQSNVVNTLGTEANPLCILIGFDYDTSGTYYVQILTS